ncbi:MAG: FecR domain-containing protein [Lachnospiraceae bacterium]|nr:FecR domain-containing protein [Lachnospiraceae bacterium]
MEKIWDMIREEKAIVFSGIATIVVVAMIGAVIWNVQKGSGMKLLQSEGAVVVEDQGTEKAVMSTMKISSGNIVNTGAESYAKISLDDTKFVTLEAQSRAEFYQNKRRYELHLTEGQMLFNITKYLENNESFDICLSTMTLAVKGTAGYVSVDASGQEWLYLADGKVHITATNPTTGEQKEADVFAGSKVTTRCYSNRVEESVEIVIADLVESDLPTQMLRELAADRVLLRRVSIATGFSEARLLELAGVATDTENTDEENTDAQDVESEELAEEELAEEEPAPEEEPEESEEEPEEEDNTSGMNRRERTRRQQTPEEEPTVEEQQENTANHTPAPQPGNNTGNNQTPNNDVSGGDTN